MSAPRDLLAEVLPADELLELVERRDRLLAEGRRAGQQANRERCRAHRAAWEAQAKRILAERPYLSGDLEQVAIEVREWCRVHRVRLKSGRDYRADTIRRYLRVALSSKPSSDFTQSQGISCYPEQSGAIPDGGFPVE